MKHTWEPTDNQGYEMECVHCGQSISLWEEQDENGETTWSREIDAECPHNQQDGRLKCQLIDDSVRVVARENKHNYPKSSGHDDPWNDFSYMHLIGKG